ncbi:MAG: ribosome small subunit-dependent GTPase A [Clostridiales bacterium]|jgi:ribosome biogenesis GTPase|nr:ribosome small subunit-dependent GTPase A [Clostridiales bacterium]
MQKEGLILKGIGGFYYVEAEGVTYECRARGIFRKEGITPLPGDRVLISLNEAGENTIDEILPRKNYFARPPLANLDLLILVVSVCEPVPNTLVIDKLLASAHFKGIDTAIVVTKGDKKAPDELLSLYKKVGITTFAASGITYDGIEKLKKIISGKICAFAGNSGVGKTTLLNAIDKSLDLETAKISKKLGRGKHTTRHSELFKLGEGFIADTPGFASIDLVADEEFLKEDLQFCFVDFIPFIEKCKFTGCSHIKTKGCEIIRQVEQGGILQSRYESYISMYDELKDKYSWS